MRRAWPARLPRDLVIPETTLWFNLEVSARRYPDKAAYVFFGRELSFRELHRQAEALAGWLQAQGVRPATACCCSCRTARSSWSPSTPSSAPTRWWCRSTR